MNDENEIPDNSRKTNPLEAIAIIIAFILLIWRFSHLHDPPRPDPMQITNKDILHMDSLVRELEQREQARKTISGSGDSGH